MLSASDAAPLETQGSIEGIFPDTLDELSEIADMNAQNGHYSESYDAETSSAALHNWQETRRTTEQSDCVGYVPLSLGAPTLGASWYHGYTPDATGSHQLLSDDVWVEQME